MTKNMSPPTTFIFKNNSLFKLLSCKNHSAPTNPATYVTDTIIRSPNMRTAACVIAICTLDTGVASKYAIAPLST